MVFVLPKGDKNEHTQRTRERKFTEHYNKMIHHKALKLVLL